MFICTILKAVMMKRFFRPIPPLSASTAREKNAGCKGALHEMLPGVDGLLGKTTRGILTWLKKVE
jgi:hypothetical protein